MSESSALNVDWPLSLPLPYVDFSGQPRHATLISPLGSAKIVRRTRFVAGVVTLPVSWMLTPEQYDAFKAFFLEDLGSGAALFLMELRYPRNSALSEWTVRFVEGYESRYLDGVWEVRAELDLLQTALAAVSPVFSASGFMVVSEESEGESEDFIEADGHPFYVQA